MQILILVCVGLGMLVLLGLITFLSSYGQNAFFYDAAEGLLTSVLLLIAEYCPKEQRHIVSVFKLIQDLLAPSPVKGKNDPSQSLQMIQRPLMTPDELKSLPKGRFILAETGCHPMKTELRLFFKWGIEFEEEYKAEQHAARMVSYADRLALEQEILNRPPFQP